MPVTVLILAACALTIQILILVEARRDRTRFDRDLQDLSTRVQALEQAESPHPDLHSDTERAGAQRLGFTIDMPNHESW